MKQNGKTRFFDLVLYIGLAIAVLGIVLGGAFFSAKHPDINDDVIEIPTLLLLVSLLMFGMLVRDFYAYVKTARLWLSICFLFIAHLGAGVFLGHMHRFHGNYMLLVLIILIPEYLILKKVLGALIDDKLAANARNRKDN